MTANTLSPDCANDHNNRVLMLADNLRLPYRVMRCAASCFNEVFVLGTPAAKKLDSSRYCKKFISNAHSWAESGLDVALRINEICARYAISHVLPSCAMTGRFLSIWGSALAVRHYPVPSLSVFNELNDKWRFASLCASLGVPSPKTVRASSREDIIELLHFRELRLPVILKPVDMWGSIGVQKVENIDDVPKKIDYSPILVQEFVAGEDLCAFFFCIDGRVVRSVSYRRIGVRIKFIFDPEVDRLARAIITKVSFSGVIGFDVRRDPEGGTFFIECNPRFWYRVHLALIMGINFVELGFDANQCAPQAIEAHLDTEVFGHRNILIQAMLPWRLNRHDRALLRYLASDPMPTLWGVLERALDPAFMAAGTQF